MHVCLSAAVQESGLLGEDQLDHLLHQQDGLLAGGQPGQLVGEDQLKGDYLIEEENPASFSELQHVQCEGLQGEEEKFGGNELGVSGPGFHFQLDVQGDGKPLQLQLGGEDQLCQLVDEGGQLCHLYNSVLGVAVGEIVGTGLLGELPVLQVESGKGQGHLPEIEGQEAEG